MNALQNIARITLSLLQCLFLFFITLYILILIPTLALAGHIMSLMGLTIATMSVVLALALTWRLLARKSKQLAADLKAAGI